MPDGRQEEEADATAGKIEGRYANYFQIGYNAFEFLLDFGQQYSDCKQETFHTRIITGPPYAKELLKVLGDTVEQYERAFGSIKQRE